MGDRFYYYYRIYTGALFCSAFRSSYDPSLFQLWDTEEVSCLWKGDDAIGPKSLDSPESSHRLHGWWWGGKTGHAYFVAQVPELVQFLRQLQERRRPACHEPTLPYGTTCRTVSGWNMSKSWCGMKINPTYFSPAKCLSVDEVRSFYNGRLPSKPSTPLVPAGFPEISLGEKGFAIEHSTAIKATKGWERESERERESKQPALSPSTIHHPIVVKCLRSLHACLIHNDHHVPVMRR